MTIRVLHFVKTSDGAQWAARQARVLRDLGVEVHVALPSSVGMAVSTWKRAGSVLHYVDANLPVRRPWLLGATLESVRRLVDELKPDLIHSHFVSTTCTLRLALGKDHSIKRLYQVAGPLHLENPITRQFEIGLAGQSDFWIGSSRCIGDWYCRSGVAQNRVFLSYYGFEVAGLLAKANSSNHLRPDKGRLVVGNVNWMYPPKYYLGQTVGLKCHEDVIDALGLAIKANPMIYGRLVGGALGAGKWYEERLRKRAQRVGGDCIELPGQLSPEEAPKTWETIDLAVHVPLSENCGGVLEPFIFGVPVIASQVGGLPEVVMDNVTGFLVPPRRPDLLAQTILKVIDDWPRARQLAQVGKRLVVEMFDVERTAREVHGIYQYVLGQTGQPPAAFDSQKFVETLKMPTN